MLGTYMQVCLVAGIIVAMPVLVYQLIAFVAPALTPHAKKNMSGLYFLSYFLCS
jgi:Sec-independent protein secretion pathway component TatC